MLLISAVILLLAVIVLAKSIDLQAKNKEYKKQEVELQSQIDKQKERSEEIAQFQAYVGTDEYVKEIAQERLGLVDPNEIIFKPAQ